MTTKHLVSVPPIELEFLHHLSLSINNRILFSAPFGSGKTTFLDRVITSDRYIYVRLVPVNYSVSMNEDVYELIKYDILNALMDNYSERFKLEPEHFPISILAQMYILNKSQSLLGFGSASGQLVESLVKDEGITEFFALSALGIKLNKALNGLTKSFKKYREEVSKAGSLKLLEDFMSSQDAKTLSNHNDAITNLIQTLISKIKEKTSPGKEMSVLVIDDLDRLDPEHIFRLFNIFSTHYNDDMSENKFGFDKVIFVCDLDNIRRIYQHKYGFKVDFAGYIDKFHSTTPFHFNILRFVKQELHTIVGRYKFMPDKANELKEAGDHIFMQLVQYLVFSLLQAKRMNLRKLFNYSDPQIPINALLRGEVEFFTSNFPILPLFHFLHGVYGSWELVNDNLQFLAEEKDYITRGDNFPDPLLLDLKTNTNVTMSACLPFLIDKSIFFSQARMYNGSAFYDVTAHSDKLNLDLKFNHAGSNFYFLSALSETSGEIAFDNFDNYNTIFKTFTECYKSGLLNKS